MISLHFLFFLSINVCYFAGAFHVFLSWHLGLPFSCKLLMRCKSSHFVTYTFCYFIFQITCSLSRLFSSFGSCCNFAHDLLSIVRLIGDRAISHSRQEFESCCLRCRIISSILGAYTKTIVEIVFETGRRIYTILTNRYCLPGDLRIICSAITD